MTTQNSIDRDSIGSAPVDSVEIPDLEARIDIPATEPVAIAGRRSQASPWRVFFRKPSTLFFGPLLVVIALVSFIGPFFVGDPVSTAHPVLAPPSLEYPLGTDQLGRDYLARVVYGGQVSLLCGSALIGALLVLVTDTLGRLAFAPLQIPAGIVIALVGCPFFVVLLWRRRDAL